MVASRFVGIAAIVGLAIVSTADNAAARTHHRHRSARSRQFVYPTQEEAKRAPLIGQIGGFFETGIPGATTADPYEHPAYGYDARGRYGPGYVYPGY